MSLETTALGKAESISKADTTSLEVKRYFRSWEGLYRYIEFGNTISYTISALVLLLIFLTYREYGFTIDEHFGYARSIRVFENIMRGTPINFEVANFYGSMPDFVALLFQKIFPDVSFWSRHLVSAVFGLIGAIFLYKICLDFIDKNTGLLAQLFLIINPMWYGYMFFNLKDIPYATLLLVSYYYCLRIIVGAQSSRWTFVKVAISVGMLAATKLIGVMMLGVFGVITMAIFSLIPGDQRLRFDRSLLNRLLLTGLAAFAGCVFCLSVFWPQIFIFQPSQILESIAMFINFERWDGRIFIHGDQIPVTEAPWYYMSWYFAICMPLFILVLFASSPLALWKRMNPLAVSAAAIVIFMISYQAVSTTRVYGGFRHFMFLVPFAMLLAAFTASTVFRYAKQNYVRFAMAAFLLVGNGSMLVEHYRLFPYQYVFYNSLVGGTSGALSHYYIDVWRSGSTESLRQLQRLGELEDRVVTVRGCAPPINKYLFPNVKLVQDREKAEYLISVPRRCDAARLAYAKIVFEVKRDGVLLSSLHLNPQYKSPDTTAAVN